MRYLQVSDRFCADYAVDGSTIIGRSHYDAGTRSDDSRHDFD